MSVTGEDYRNAALATLIPGAGAVAAFAVFVNDRGTVDWWKHVKKPDWAPSNMGFYSVMDLLTMSPIGCASYLVYKHGEGLKNTDTKLALGMYGASLATCLVSIGVAMKRDLKMMFYCTIPINLAAIGTAVAFHKVHKQAGYMMVPYAMWTGFYVFFTFSLWQKNKEADD